MKRIDNIKNLYNNISLPLKVSFWFFFCSLLQKGLSFLTTPIFTRVLNTTEYGVVSIYNSWEQIIIIFLTMNLANSVFNVGLVKFDTDRENFQTSMIGLETLFAFVMSVILILAYPVLFPYIQLDYKYIYIMVIQCFFTTIVGMWTLRQRFDYNYKKMTIISVINIVAGVGLSLLFVFLFYDKPFAKICGGVIILSTTGIYCFVDNIQNSHEFYNAKYWNFALKYNIPMIPHFLSSVILNQLDRIMIQNMVGLSQAGIYAVAYSSAGVVYIFNQALVSSYNPWLLRRLKKKHYSGIKETVNAILLLYLAILLVIILFAPEIMKIMATNEYHEGIYIIPPVACSMFFILLFNMFAPVEHFSLKTKFLGIASVFSAFANIILNYIFIRKFGYLVAGYTTLTCYIIYAFAHWIYMKKCCKEMGNILIYDDKRTLIMSITVVAIAIISAIVYSYPIIRYTIIVCIIIACVISRKHFSKIFREVFRKNSIKSNSEG